jgi:transglutaminase-like putative cysteine protease
MTDWSPQPLTYVVVHRTTYSYSAAVSDAYSITNLMPRSTPLQQVIRAEVTTDPLADEYEERLDSFGNRVVQIGLHRAHDRFEVVGRSEVEVFPGTLPASDTSWEEVVSSLASARGADAVELGAFLALTPPVTPQWTWAHLDGMFAPDFEPGRPLVDVARAVCSRIYGWFQFDPTATDVSTPLDDVVGAARGVCQDFAHLAIAVFRRRGLAARYVSGYIETDPPPGEPKSIGADASHAWCALWVPDTGWVDIDPTNDQLPANRHVTVAWGRDYRDVAPVRGVVIGPSAAQFLDVSVDVQRL